jgi:hypothetical protein
MSGLAEIRARLARLKANGREPRQIVMSTAAWDALKAEYVAETGRDSSLVISGREVLGAPLEIHADMLTIAIEWESEEESGIDE